MVKSAKHRRAIEQHDVLKHHPFKEIAQRWDCAYLAQELVAGVRVHGAVHALAVRQGQQQERSYPGRSLVGRRDWARDGAGGGAGRGAEESVRVPRLGAQPGALGRRLVV